MGSQYRRNPVLMLVWMMVFVALAFEVASPRVYAGTPAFGPVPRTVPAKAAGAKPTTDVIFNDPRGSHTREYAIVNRIVRFINGTPRGEKIRLAYYWFEIVAVAEALIAADKRKVEVDILLDKVHVKEKAAKALIAAFKRGGVSKKSSVLYRTGIAQLMHMKLMLSSRVGDAKNVVGYGSANLSVSNAKTNANDFIFKTNSPNYSCLKKEFDRIANPNNKGRVTVGRTCTSKGLLTQVTPAKGKSPWITRGTSRIKCVPGTKVRGAIMQWSDTEVARAFLALQEDGCDVQLLVTRPTKKHWVSPKVFKVLKAKTKHHGRVKVFVPRPGHGIHLKWLAVKGPKQAWVMTGSLHPSKGSQSGIQLLVREDNKPLTDQYFDQFDKLTAKSRARLYK